MANDRTQAQDKAIRLDFRSVEQVVVVPEDEDRFMTTMREAAIACKKAQSEKEFKEEFDKFLIFLRDWFAEHEDRIRVGYVGVGDGTLNILACTRSSEYDFEFDGKLTDFDLEIVARFPWAIVDVIQLPSCAAESAISLEKAILVYGDGSPAPTAGRA